MTLNELKVFVARFTYKPKAYVRVIPVFKFWTIEVGLWCEDAESLNRNKLNYVKHITSPFTADDLKDYTEELVIAKIENAIISIEHHEINEWLRIDNRYVSDPHPETAHGKNYLRRKT